MRRRDGLRLLVTLPDGTRSLIPAAWTAVTSAQSGGTPATTVVVGSLADLFQARAVVDAFLGRLVAAGDERAAGTEESGHATVPAVRRQTKATQRSVDPTACTTAGRSRRSAGAADCTDGRGKSSAGGPR